MEFMLTSKGDETMIYPYKINTKEDLYRLSELASKEDYPIYISTSLGQLDAKSLLALFTILGKEVNLVSFLPSTLYNSISSGIK